MNLLRLLGCIMLMVLLSIQVAIAQQYPVQVITQLYPPHTLNLPQWYNGSSEKLVVLLTNQDFYRTTDVRLRLQIEGPSVRLSSRVGAYLPIITLNSGEPVRLSLGDLAPYFNPDNLNFDGINRASYLNSYTLPEGFYRICFEAVEVRSGQVVGRGMCAQAWLSLNDPPFLNLPKKGESITHREPPNIVFQWTPRHMMDPNLAFNTEYEFSLVEVWDNGINPEGAFLSNQPLYRTTTQSTMLVYGPMEPMLIPGKRYAWRIRVQSADGSKNSAFKNHGYSEVFWFTYQKDCPPPLHIQADPMVEAARIKWTPAMSMITGTDGTYKVDYRLRDDNSPGWMTEEASGNRATLYPLLPDRTYEYRVGHSCDDNLSFVYSDIKQFTTKGEEPEQECGEGDDEPEITNLEPIQTLHVGDIITSGGGLRTRIVQVSGQGSFTGYGYATMPLTKHAQFKIKFSNIKVNTDKQLIEGTIESVSSLDPVYGSGKEDGQIVDVSIVKDLKPLLKTLDKMFEKLKSGLFKRAEALALTDELDSSVRSYADKVNLSKEDRKSLLADAEVLKTEILASANTSEGDGALQQKSSPGAVERAKKALEGFKDRLSAKRESSAISTAYLGTELYISPSGYPVKVPDAQIKQFMYDADKINKTYPNGALYGYKNANDVLFLAKIEKGKFLGYENQQTKELYIDTTSYRGKVKVFILEELNDGCQYKQYTISYTVPAKMDQVLNSLNLSGLTKDDIRVRDRCSNAPDIRAKPDPTSGPKHLALFVNGYRSGYPEKSDSDNVVATNDRHSYWEGVDHQFSKQLGSGTRLYADGHHGIRTSNHQNMLSFYNSAKHTIGPLPSSLSEFAIKYVGGMEKFTSEYLPPPAIGAAATMVRMNSEYVGGKLNTEANEAGFNERRMNGKKAGAALLSDIQSQKIRVRRDAEDNLIDTLDIVAHSMGYAYALGMVDILKGKVPLGRFYIIAPENASAGEINLNDFEEVWQYGSNLGEPNADPLHMQDGVAPQAAVRGLEKIKNEQNRGRAFIPDGEPKGFLTSHSIGNYKWIFTRGKEAPGYVKPRK